MNQNVVLRMLGQLLLGFSVTMLPPVVVSLLYGDGEWPAFLQAAALVAAVGAMAWWPNRQVETDLRLRDGFILVTLFWLVIGVAGALPLVFAKQPELDLAGAVFEAVSGLTTTGATVISGLDLLPKSVLWYRQQLQWLGGVGIVVLAVALLPVLGVGGMQLYRAETPGAVKDKRLTPRILQTAKRLSLVYLLLTVACIAAYSAAGMGGFDAIAHAFSTVSTGGFSTHDASLGYFQNPNIEWVAILFMFLGGVNFTLHFMAWSKGAGLRQYWEDPEFRAYCGVLVAMGLFIALYLWNHQVHPAPGTTLRHAAFAWVAMQTTTGFVTEGFQLWPGPLPALLILATFIGGCAGSAAGGMKVIRWQLVAQEAHAEMRRLVHPSAEVLVKYAGRPVAPRVLSAVAGFFAVYLLLFGVLMLALMMTGLDQVSAWSAVATTLNNTGAGLGSVAANFQQLTDTGRWITVAAMLLGRLEVFTVLVVFTPMFWRR
jgi:trk system potassium uptake protein TrkH